MLPLYNAEFVAKMACLKDRVFRGKPFWQQNKFGTKIYRKSHKFLILARDILTRFYTIYYERFRNKWTLKEFSILIVNNLENFRKKFGQSDIFKLKSFVANFRNCNFEYCQIKVEYSNKFCGNFLISWGNN